MANNKGNGLRNSILDHILGGPDYTRKATLYLALYTAAPTSAGGGTEVTGGGYARVALTNNVTNFPASSSGSKSNGVLWAFPAATADFGTIVAFALHDHITNDSIVYFGALTANRSVPNGAIADFPIGTLSFSET